MEPTGETILNEQADDTATKFDVTIKARIYHGRLLQIANENGGISALARMIGVSSATLGDWTRMESAPIRGRDRAIRAKTMQAVKKLCRIGKCNVKALWPDWFDDVLKVEKKIEFTKSVEPTVFLGGIRLNDQPLSALPSPSDVAEQHESAEIVERLMANLNPRLQKIIRMRNMDNMTLEETGLAIGVTKERVRELQVKAMKKLRDEAAKTQFGEEMADGWRSS